MGRKKRQAKKEMKLKINGKEQPLKEDVVIKDWNKAKKEIAAAQEKMDSDEFEWILPEKKLKEVPEFQPAQSIPDSSSKEKSSKIKLSKYFPKRWIPNKTGLLISTILAISIGLGFGLFVLKLVVNPESEAALTDAAPAASPGQTGGQGEALTATMPGISAAVVQGGVFSTEEAAQNYSDQFASQGFPTISLGVDDQQFLFVGIANDLDVAKTWSADYETRGIDVYAKEFIIPENQLKVESETEAEWMKEAPAVFQTLAAEVANAQSSGQINEKSLQDTEQTMNKYDDKNMKGEIGINLKAQLNEAHKELAAFSTSGDSQSLTKAQQSLMNFFKAYYDASKGSSV